MDTNQRIALAGRCSEQAYRRLLQEGRELWASFSMEDVFKTLTATIRLDYSNFVAETAPSTDAYLLLYKQVVLEGLDSGAVAPVAPITSLGEAVLTSWRRETNVGAENLPELKREPTAQERLEAECEADWNGGLPGDKIREKQRTNRAYRECLERLLQSDRLSPNVSAKIAY